VGWRLVALRRGAFATVTIVIAAVASLEAALSVRRFACWRRSSPVALKIFASGVIRVVPGTRAAMRRP
jgi:hypothetical protein